MRVATTTISDNIINQIQKLGMAQARLQNQVATGQRIFQPDDDPSAVGRVLNLESEQRLLDQFARNADRAMTLSQATFSGLQSVKRVSDRATELATLGSSSVGADAARAYGVEVDQLLEQALQLANSRQGNDYLYAGTAVDSPPFVATRDAQGRITAIAYAGNSGRAEIPLSSSSSVAPGTTNDTNLGLKDFLNHLVALRDALSSANTAGVITAQTGLLTTEDTIVAAMADNGGIQSRIEAARTQQQDVALSFESLISKETDADMPTTIVKLSQTQTAYQAALQSGANIMRVSLLDYIR